jgi:hypothetical protein
MQRKEENMHKVIIDGKEYIEKTEAIRMIYDYVSMNPEQEQLFEDVEKALGFKLFTWQKTYIENGTFRRNGKTLAEILRLLLAVDGEPLDFTIPPRNQREDYFRHRLREIQDKLKNAGIPIRKVFWCKKDKRDYDERMFAYLDGKRIFMSFLDVEHDPIAYGKKCDCPWKI